jgi:hypothetical protein
MRNRALVYKLSKLLVDEVSTADADEHEAQLLFIFIAQLLFEKTAAHAGLLKLPPVAFQPIVPKPVRRKRLAGGGALVPLRPDDGAA